MPRDSAIVAGEGGFRVSGSNKSKCSARQTEDSLTRSCGHLCAELELCDAVHSKVSHTMNTSAMC